MERRLAACVNVLPGVVSVYRWKGEVCRDEELLLVIKTRAERLPALREALVALHPYELPELVACRSSPATRRTWTGWTNLCSRTGGWPALSDLVILRPGDSPARCHPASRGLASARAYGSAGVPVRSRASLRRTPRGGPASQAPHTPRLSPPVVALPVG